MKLISYWLVASLFIINLLCGGCANTQNVSYATAEAIGSVVDSAMTQFATFEVNLAKTKMGTTATQAQLQAWVESDMNWINGVDIHAKYLLAYNAWIQANKLSVSGTADPQFRAKAIVAANQFISFALTFVPTLKPVQ